MRDADVFEGALQNFKMERRDICVGNNNGLGLTQHWTY